MNISKSYTIWLETAYRLFAEKGLDDFSIKELANQCGLPRTNFYYYFNDREELIDKIIDLHFQTTTEIFNIELTKRFTSFIPDLYTIIYDFKIGIQFAKQLFKNREDPKFNDAYIKGVALSADLIIPKFKDYFKLKLSDEKAKELWFTLTDAWYSRLNFDDFTVNYLCNSGLEIMDSIMPLIENDTNQK